MNLTQRNKQHGKREENQQSKLCFHERMRSIFNGRSVSEKEKASAWEKYHEEKEMRMKCH